MGYLAIQDAVEAPETSSGDTIFAGPETYFENLNIDKPIYLIGQSAAETIIDGGGNDTVIHVTQDNVTITRLTIQNGYTIQSSGSGVFLDAVNGCEITQDNITANGDGIFGYGDNNTISDNSICENQLRGIDLGYVGHEVIGNNISGNQINDNSYFGIQMVYVSKNVIMNNNISHQNVGLELYGASSQQNTVYNSARARSRRKSLFASRTDLQRNSSSRSFGTSILTKLGQPTRLAPKEFMSVIVVPIPIIDLTP